MVGRSPIPDESRVFHSERPHHRAQQSIQGDQDGAEHQYQPTYPSVPSSSTKAFGSAEAQLGDVRGQPAGQCSGCASTPSILGNFGSSSVRWNDIKHKERAYIGWARRHMPYPVAHTLDQSRPPACASPTTLSTVAVLARHAPRLTAAPPHILAAHIAAHRRASSISERHATRRSRCAAQRTTRETGPLPTCRPPADHRFAVGSGRTLRSACRALLGSGVDF